MGESDVLEFRQVYVNIVLVWQYHFDVIDLKYTIVNMKHLENKANTYKENITDLGNGIQN